MRRARYILFQYSKTLSKYNLIVSAPSSYWKSNILYLPSIYVLLCKACTIIRAHALERVWERKTTYKRFPMVIINRTVIKYTILLTYYLQCQLSHTNI